MNQQIATYRGWGTSRRGFTLVELLVTISIIAVLSALALGALYSAQDQAKTMKTRGTIVKLHNIMMARYESYKTRRVPIVIPAGTSPNVAAAMRLTALRQLMLWEMPDRNSEVPAAGVTSASYPFSWTDSLGNSRSHSVVIARPSVSYYYMRKLGSPSDTQYQSAELLYLIVSAGGDEESDIAQFSESEIGDFDKDGRREFIDAWGNPISWVRWPVYFVSELQPAVVTHNPAAPEEPTVVRDTERDHDPFDPRRVDDAAFAVFPLIFSAGPDGKHEINSGPAYAYSTNGAGILNPYIATPRIGGWTDQDSDGEDGSIDNIHNHLIGTR